MNVKMLSNKEQSVSHEGLTRIKDGEILILGDGETSALLIKQAFHAEFITAGSAVGGSFDRNVTEFHTIGHVTFTAPLNLNERYRAIKQRQADVDRMLQLWQEKDCLKRATNFLELITERFGYEEAKNIPADFLVRLTGTHADIIEQAWDKMTTIDITDTTIFPATKPSPQLPSEVESMPTRKQRRSRLPWKLALFLGTLMISGVGLILYLLSNNLLPKATPAISEVNPSASPLPAKPKPISALGYIEPQGEVVLLSAPAFMEGSRVEKLLVRQGDSVTKGTTVAILDNHDRLQAIVEQAQQSVKIAEAKLRQVKAGSKVGDIKAQDSKYSSTKAELEGQINSQQAAIANLESQLEGERSTQEALILQIKAELSNATIECNRYEMLVEGGAISSSQRDNICLNKTTAQERLSQANSSLTRIVNTRQQQIREAQSNLERTINTLKNELDATANSRDAIAEVRPVDVQLATQELISAQAAVKKSQTDLAQAFVRSPMDGQVLKINTWPGELVNQQKGVVELGRTSQMYVSADIYETDIGRVRQGQKAKIRADRVTGELTGYVDQIGMRIGAPNTLGTDPVKDADVRVVTVKIRLVPSDSKKVANLTNLQVNVVINPNP